MNAEQHSSEQSNGPMFELDFEMPLAEYLEVSRQIAWMSRHGWLLPSTGIALVAVAAFSAGLHFGSPNATASWRSWVFGGSIIVQLILGWNMATNNWLTTWLGRSSSVQYPSRTHLQLDEAGLRGEIASPTPWHKYREMRRINYVWQKVRRRYDPRGYLVLEFHGGGVVTIPTREFASLTDLQRVVEWAEAGMAKQRLRLKVRARPAA